MSETIPRFEKGTTTMTDNSGEVAALGGSWPSATGPGATGGGPTGGGKAVPHDEVLMRGSGTLGDTASMEDGSPTAATAWKNRTARWPRRRCPV